MAIQGKDATHLPISSWPRLLRRAEAARYLGVNVSTFTAEVRAGVWPQGQPRGGEGSILTWGRVLLDRAADALAGLSDRPGLIAEQPALEE